MKLFKSHLTLLLIARTLNVLPQQIAVSQPRRAPAFDTGKLTSSNAHPNDANLFVTFGAIARV